MWSGLRPTTSSSSCTLRARSPLGATSVWMSYGSPMMSPTVIRGFSEVYGSCITIWMLRRIRLSSAPLALAMSRPLIITEPEVGRSSAMRTLASVDLPQPDSPTMPSVSPRSRSKETPSTALMAPICLFITIPWVRGKCLTRSRTSRMRSPLVAIEDLPPVVAGAVTGAADLVERGGVGHAVVLAVGAPRMEGAAGRHVEQVRRQALDGVQLVALEID